MKIKIDDELPESDFFYLDNSNALKKINTKELFSEKKIIIIGVPGAFTNICSKKHLPGYIKNFNEAQKKGIDKIVCISVNDANVMKAWGESQQIDNKIFMAADPFCKFTKEIGADVDKTEKGLGIRSSRYTMLIENGKVKMIREEEDTGICEISAAENFISAI